MEFHKRAWKCPTCGRWRAVRHPFDRRGAEFTRTTKCRCGARVIITTTSEVIMVPELRVELINAEEK